MVFTGCEILHHPAMPRAGGNFWFLSTSQTQLETLQGKYPGGGASQTHGHEAAAAAAAARSMSVTGLPGVVSM